MRLINANETLGQLNAMAEELKGKTESDGVAGYYWRGAMYALESAATAIKEQPTVEERQHGHWIEINPPDDKNNFVQCSFCGQKFGLYHRDNYCQYCGAKMDEVTDDGQ